MGETHSGGRDDITRPTDTEGRKGPLWAFPQPLRLGHGQRLTGIPPPPCSLTSMPSGGRALGPGFGQQPSRTERGDGLCVHRRGVAVGLPTPVRADPCKPVSGPRGKPHACAL